MTLVARLIARHVQGKLLATGKGLLKPSGAKRQNSKK
jgi:hypothetical protein